jgi:4-amino-4-deoxy-L-arabinose transferase-like glycosyltransferase
MAKHVRWIAAASFVWLAFVYASYYMVQQQRPVSAANLRALGSVLLDLGAACAILAAGAGVGRRVCRWLRVPLVHPGEEFVFSAGVGLGVLSFLVLGMGLLGWLMRWAMALLFGGLIVLTWRDVVGAGRALAALRTVRRPPGWLKLYLGGMFLLALLVALAPPIDWDGLFYHLILPRLYIEQGRITPVTDMPHQYFPGLVEMLYLAAMLLRGDVAAKLVHFGFMLLLAALVYVLARRHAGVEHGWPAVAVYAAIPMVPVLGGWAYNDLALAFYQAAALYALSNWFHEDRLQWVLLSAACCGLAMGVKYTGFVCPLAIVTLMAWRMARGRSSWRAGIRALGLFCGVTLLAAAPWYVRNLASTGNPVYPFLYRVFGGSGWDEWRAAWYARAGSGLGWNLAALAALPWTLTLGVRDTNFYDGRAGPLFLLALPFLLAWCLRLFGRRRPRPLLIGILLFFALVQYVFWTVGVVASQSLFQSRLLLPALVALCVPLVYVYDQLAALDTRVFSLRRLIGFSVALVLAANLCYQFLDVLRQRPLPLLVGLESREAYLERNLGVYYAAMKQVNERTPEGGRVLFLWEPRSYYCQRAVQPDPILERWAWLLHLHGGDLESIAGALRKEGYTHLLIHRAGRDFVLYMRIDPLGEPNAAALDLFLASYARELASVGEVYALYEVLDE